MDLISLAEQGRVPDWLIRVGIRRLLAPKAHELDRIAPSARAEGMRRFLAELRNSPIAVATDDANTQHYEVSSSFFLRVLGPRLKYSACVWPEGVTTLAEAEERTLSLTAERARLSDGQTILELGCGWGSFSLWAAEQFPRSKILAISNSTTQRSFIRQRAEERGLTNLEVQTADAREFSTDRTFDRIVSIEMFEHLRNIEAMLARVRTWINPNGYIFLHIFTHRGLPYIFPTEGPTDWMGREFFTGGMMPSDDMLLHMQDSLVLDDHWQIDGTDYAQASRSASVSKLTGFLVLSESGMDVCPLQFWTDFRVTTPSWK